MNTKYMKYFYAIIAILAIENKLCASLEEKLIDFAIAGRPKEAQIAALTQYAASGSQIASDKLRPLLPPTLTQLFTAPMPAPMPAPITLARTEKEEYQIALKVLERSKELQDYAVLLVQARKP